MNEVNKEEFDADCEKREKIKLKKKANLLQFAFLYKILLQQIRLLFHQLICPAILSVRPFYHQQLIEPVLAMKKCLLH